MKSIVTLIAAACITLLGTTTQADARHYKNKNIYISSYQSCGTPIYTERYLVGYDACGEPIYGHRTVRSHYQPVVRPQYRPVVRQRHAEYHSNQDYRRDRHHGRHSSRNRVIIQQEYCR